MSQKKVLVVILGPTAVGKTSVGIELALHLDTEIISADSRQFFRELSIGTAKPSEEELNTVKHHFVNNISITEQYNAGKFELEASATIEKLFEKYNTLLLVGGSGMYINAVCKGFDSIPEVSNDIRNELNELYKNGGIEELQKKLKQLDPKFYEEVDKKNPQRLIRALEVCLASGLPYSTFREGIAKKRSFEIIKIGLNIDRKNLYELIEQRVDKMMADGLLNEVKELFKYNTLNSLQTVGYKELFNHLGGGLSLEKAIELIKQNTRNFAKRQLTWFRRDEEIIWFNPTERGTIIAFVDGKLKGS